MPDGCIYHTLSSKPIGSQAHSHTENNHTQIGEYHTRIAIAHRGLWETFKYQNQRATLAPSNEATRGTPTSRVKLQLYENKKQ